MSAGKRAFVAMGVLVGGWLSFRAVREFAEFYGSSSSAAVTFLTEPEAADVAASAGAAPATSPRGTAPAPTQQSAGPQGSAARDVPRQVLPEIGHLAPEIQAFVIDGSKNRRLLARNKGDVILVYIWATWCPYCRDEMPNIEQLHRAFRQEGLRVVAVAANGSDRELREMARTRGLSFEIVRDDNGVTEKAYAINGYPATYIIDRHGVIRAIRRGFGDNNHGRNITLVRQLLNEW